MEPKSNLTFEEVDKHIEAADLSAFEVGGKYHVAAGRAAAPADAAKGVCAIYKVIRPILVFLSNWPFLPLKWRKALKAFIAAMDVLCP